MDFGELAHQTVDALRPFLAAGAAASAKTLAEKVSQESVRLYDWLKSRMIRPAAAASLADAGEKPTSSRIEALRAQIMTLIEEDEPFRRELESRLARAPGSQQFVKSEGHGTVTVQSAGHHAVIHATSGYHADLPQMPPTAPAPTPIPRPPPGVIPPGRHDVFLCHNSRDKLEVTRLAQRLLELGISPWVDLWALRRDQQLQPQLEAAIESLPCLIVLVGPNATGPWQEQEMFAAVQEFIRRKRGVVVALLPGAPVDPELPLFLRDFPRVDLRAWSNSGEPGLLELIAGIFGVTPEGIAGSLNPQSVAVLRARRG